VRDRRARADPREWVARSLGPALLAAALLATAGAAAQPAGAPAALRPPAVALPRAPEPAALPADTAAQSVGYGWPLRPFDRVHAIRGWFGDPRFGLVQRNFHFGVDISAAGGTPVFAVAPGKVFLEPDRVTVYSRADPGDEDGFSYWHIYPAVAEHAVVVRHTLLGWVKPFWDHLHFAELQDGEWINPLRRDGLRPLPATRRPRIEALGVVPCAGDRVDLILEASVAPREPPPAPWQLATLAPRLIRWRLLAHGAPVTAWDDAVDFRIVIPPNPLFATVYAPATTQNEPGRPGRYRFYLARSWNLAGLRPGRYTIEAQAFGLDAPSAVATLALTVAPRVDMRAR
jgi:hypothetical protein